jgi:hypothetical protein
MNRDIRFTVQIEDDVFEDVEMSSIEDSAGAQKTISVENKADSNQRQPDSHQHPEVPSRSDSKRQKIESTKGFRPQLRPAIAELQVFYDNQRDFRSIPIVKERTVIGRTTGDVTIENDRMISSQHAEIIRQHQDDRYRWRLRDLGSTNGIFINVDRAKLNEGDEILLGSHRYRLWHHDDCDYLQWIENGKIAGELVLAEDGICVGREQSTVMESFWDELLDPKHAFVQKDRRGCWSIKNLQSTNGVWYRISELPLTRKCFFQIGEQRFGFRY